MYHCTYVCKYAMGQARQCPKTSTHSSPVSMMMMMMMIMMMMIDLRIWISTGSLANNRRSFISSHLRIHEVTMIPGGTCGSRLMDDDDDDDGDGSDPLNERGYEHIHIHIHIRAYIHTYIHTYIYTYIHTSINPSIQTSIHPSIHTYIIHHAHPPPLPTYLPTYLSLLLSISMVDSSERSCRTSSSALASLTQDSFSFSFNLEKRQRG